MTSENQPQIKVIRKTNLRETVARALRAAIISGEMVPGVVYSAPSLGARFGVSATPVREAMLDLVRENLVTVEPNKGFRVTEVSEEDLDQMAAIRLLLEPPVVRSIVSEVPAADLPRLREMAQEIVDRASAADLVGYTDADREFHLRLLDYSGNRRLVELVADLRSHSRLLGLNALVESNELSPSAEEHLKMVDLIEQGKAEELEELMRSHILKVREMWASPPAS
ncbi:GntR family transcriptional regulator [Arthrobacter citreus]|uniref:GntR family transcriptional regulator n=1 Tax=Arthrobacter TaxID=1663 RepID=UPI0012656E8E|nr:GntR family transcriptional regulator [Arthrobacter gandavensis]